MTHAQSLSTMMGPAAAALLGAPNERLSRLTDGVLRFGNQGSIEVNVGEGWFSDYEAGVRGGVLDLIKHKGGAANDAAALTWLEEHGIKDKSDRRAVTQPEESRFYDYRDEGGAVIFRVERRVQDGRKTFLQHGPDGSGGFVCRKGCMQGVRRLLYRLPELLNADRDAVVFVCEGEKDADRLASAGLVATTNPGGAGKFLPDYVPHLTGRNVVVLEDNDQPGRDHAADVVTKLSGAAKSVAVLRLPGLPEKGDVSDWIAAGGSLADLSRLADQALSDASKVSLPIAASPYLWADPESLPRRPWVYGRQLLRGSVFLVVAPGATGKSALMTGVAMSLCTGRPLLGSEVWGGPKRVWVWNLEDSLCELRFSIQAAALHWGLQPADLDGRLFVDSGLDGATLKLAVQDRDGCKINQAVSQAIIDELQRRQIDVLIIDPFISSHGLSENDNAAIDLVAKEWSRIASQAGSAVVLVHHARKTGGEAVTAESARGASSLVDAARGGLALNTMTEIEADKFGIDRDERRRYVDCH